MKFSIETVSKLTGIAPASLRNWEKRYGFPNPERTATGHRYYTKDDIDFLKQAFGWLKEGLPLSEIAKRYATSHNMNLVERSPSVEAITDDVTYRTQLIFDSLMKFDHPATLQHYQILNAKLDPETLFDRVFEPIFRRIGEEWHAGKISIAQEHFASSFLRLKLSSFLSIDSVPLREEMILATTLTDERHEGGLLLLSAHLKLRGYPVSYFGCDMPMKDLKDLVRDIKPHVVCLSYVDSKRLDRDFQALSELEVPICIGGLAVLTSPDYVESLRKRNNGNFYFCEYSTGSQAASYVQLICVQRPPVKR